MQASSDENRVRSLLGVSSAGFVTPITVAVNPSTHAMLVEASFSPSGTQDVNLTKVGGSAFTLGQQLAAASLPIVLTAAQIATLTPLATVAVTQSTSPWVTQESALTSVGSFQTTVTTAGTRVQLASNTCKALTVKAKTTNTGLIYVGTSTVAASNGFILSSGDAVSLDISNTNLVYIDSSVNGEGVSVIYAN